MPRRERRRRARRPALQRRVRRPAVRHRRQRRRGARGRRDLLAVLQLAARRARRRRASARRTAPALRRCRCPTRFPPAQPRGAPRRPFQTLIARLPRPCASPSSRSTRIREYALVIAANRDEFHARAGRARGMVGRGLARRTRSRSAAARGSASRASAAGRWSPTCASRGTTIPTRPRAARSWPRYLGRPPQAAALGPARDRRSAASAHNGFNLVAGEPGAAHWGSNRGAGAARGCRGIYGLSNAAARHAVAQGRAHQGRVRGLVLARRRHDDSAALRHARTTAPRRRTPSCRRPACHSSANGCCRRRSSSAPDYGTRCSTVLTIGRDGSAHFVERTFDPRRPGDVGDGRISASP